MHGPPRRHPHRLLLALILAPFLLESSSATAGGDLSIDLSGIWRFRLDPGGRGESERWFAGRIAGGTIPLPGTTDIAGKGYNVDQATMTREVSYPGARWPGTEHVAAENRRGYLVREFAYIGKAWYQRDVEVPRSWEGKHLAVLLERCLWRSDLWIDDRHVGAQDSLVAEHIHEIGSLSPGTHRLTVRIDNGLVHNIGLIGHAYGPETQSRWNGIVGRMEILARDPVFLENVAIFPATDRRSVRIRARLRNATARDVSGELSCRVETGAGEPVSPTVLTPVYVGSDARRLVTTIEVPVQDDVAAWDEFRPVRHVARVRLSSATGDTTLRDECLERFGFRTIRREGRTIRVNGRTVSLRGTLDCCVYPRTGHPPVDVEAWMRILGTIRQHGLNHVRYHSWCPPAAAFEAADRLGLYLAPETPLWIDNWTMEAGSHPEAFGEDPDVVAFIQREMDVMLERYGNHPSFALFCVGNEIGSAADWALLNSMIARARERDPRRLYTVSTARQRAPTDDYWVTHHTGRHAVRGVGPAHTDWDFAAAVASVDRPLVAHETGQRPVFPDYSALLPKFTGPLRPYNLEAFRDKLERAGLAALNEAFTRSSGRFALVQYKSEHEGILRTPGLAGFQLLMLNDFTGQGEALVGVLDPFWESKGLISPKDLLRWCAPTVPLARFEKYVWTAGETFTARLDVSHFGPRDLEHVVVTWKLRETSGREIMRGALDPADLPTGGVSRLGALTIPLGSFDGARALRLEVAVEGTEAANSWNLWVYPGGDAEPAPPGALVTDEAAAATAALAEGRRVLFLAHGLDNDRTRRTGFLSVYWSSAWFPETPGTLGIHCDPTHPALARFPTEGHSDWQWHDLTTGATTLDLDGAPADLRPIVQPVTDFHRCERLGDLFEARVGPGRLLVCGYDLTSEIDSRPVARQLRRSLLRYIVSGDFLPEVELEPAFVTLLLRAREPLPVADDVAERLPRSVLHVRAAARLDRLGRDVPWAPERDEVLRREQGFAWRVARGETWKDPAGAAWHGNPLELELDVPRRWCGSLLAHVHDWNGLGRRGLVDFDGRTYRLGVHDAEGLWMALPVEPGSTADGRIELGARPTAGPNLMITEIALIPRDLRSSR